MKNDRNFKANPLTVEELKQKAKERIIESKEYQNEGSYYDLGDGWFSTSLTNPKNGGIFKTYEDENDLIEVQFTDKYGRSNIGYIVGYGWESYIKKVTLIVVIRDFSGIISDGFYNAMLGNLNKVRSNRKIILPKFDESKLEKL